MPTFGELLKIDRERLNLSQEELAKRVGVTQQAVANWENGTSHPRKDRRVQLLQVLGPDAELVKNPPTTEFVPAQDMPADLIVKTPRGDVRMDVKIRTTPGVGIAGGVKASIHGVPGRAAVGTPMVTYSSDKPWVGFSTAGGSRVLVQAERVKMLQELQDALPEQFKANVGADLMFAQTARQYDYASEGVVARVMRGQTATSPGFSAIHVVRLAMAVRKFEPSPEPTASVVLFVLSDEPAAVVTRRMGAMHLDAMTLGIKVEVVPDVATMAKTIVELERMYFQDMQDYHAWIEQMHRDAHEHEIDTNLDPILIPGRQPSDAEPPPHPDEGTW